MEKPSERLPEKQKHGRRYGRGYTSLAFGSGWTALGCIVPQKIQNGNEFENVDLKQDIHVIIQFLSLS